LPSFASLICSYEHLIVAPGLVRAAIFSESASLLPCEGNEDDALEELDVVLGFLRAVLVLDEWLSSFCSFHGFLVAEGLVVKFDASISSRSSENSARELEDVPVPDLVEELVTANLLFKPALLRECEA